MREKQRKWEKGQGIGGGKEKRGRGDGVTHTSGQVLLKNLSMLNQVRPS